MSTITTSVGTDASTRPTVFLLSLDKQFYWDESHSDLIYSLTKKAIVKEAQKPHIALHYLAKNQPSAIIVTDPAILLGETSFFIADPAILLGETSFFIADPAKRDDSLRAVGDMVCEYVRNGGTAVLATSFSGNVSHTDLNSWFHKAWNLPWVFGEYTRETVQLNPSCRVHEATLPAEYSQKAMFLSNVARTDAVYLRRFEDPEEDDEDSEDEAIRYQPEDQAAVAFAKIGDGWLGYVGDVNNEIGSQAVVLAMCGL